jgi:hypothetical protein
MRLTIGYLTYRLHPRFEWFCASLARELRSMPDISPSEIQVVVIDGRLWYDEHRHLGMYDAAIVPHVDGLGSSIKFEHHTPKPNALQGPFRQTSRDYFCAASARNTAFAYARAGHVAFVDDLSVLLPGWLKAHIHAADNGYVLAGTTCKQRRIIVNSHGDLASFEEFRLGRDSRLDRLTEDLQDCTGGWLFGGTFSVPLDLALNVNGQDEIHDTIGGEDYDFGTRLERAGACIRISRLCGTYEDEMAHHAEAPMIRIDQPWAGPDGPYASNYLYNKMRREPSRTWTIGNTYKLRDVRTQVLGGLGFPSVPKEDLLYWVDGRRLRDM